MISVIERSIIFTINTFIKYSCRPRCNQHLPTLIKPILRIYMTSKTYLFHYVYRITNTIIQKHYYGVHSSNIEPKLDIGFKYFSSSKDKEFILDQKLNPQNYRYKVVRKLYSRTKAIELEILLHHKFDVGINPKFYNRSKQTSTSWDTSGISPSEESKRKNSESNKGRICSKESSEKKSKALTGRKLSEQNKINLSKSRKGKHYKKLSDVQRKYFYITPVGIFDYCRALESVNISKPTMRNWCMNSHKKITKYVYSHSIWLQNNYSFEEINNKTFNEIGFGYRLKSNI